jgi:phosphatidylserine/phosphatidylglycerophosphate/cardiolipin synthase-like enzyme
MSGRRPTGIAQELEVLTPIALATVFERSSGAPLVGGNDVKILLDATDNYSAWLDAIEEAREAIHLEMYIVHNDTIGQRFREALIAKARAGVAVRVLYDWFGALRPSSFRFWAPLAAAGGEIRIANPPRPDALLALPSRDHRKLLTVDGRVAFISGLCIGDDWLGDPARGVAPWRDTGVAIRGPAVADADLAFAEAWAAWGPALATNSGVGHSDDGRSRAGDVRLRVISTSPDRTSLYRLELVLISMAQSRVWLTDAYFMGTTTFLGTLSAAARHGVDVRLLLPNNSDVQWVGNASRTLYRRLLESGVRIFEWNGSMMHAKTAVADGRFVRVGSTNLNLSSWLKNWELDVVIEDDGLASQMEDIFEDDLKNATEVVVSGRKVRLDPGRVRAPRAARRGRRRFSRSVGGSAKRVVRDVALAGSLIGTAVRGYRDLGPSEAASLASFGSFALLLAALTWWFPKAIAWPLAIVAALIGITLIVRAVKALASRPPQ